MCSTNKLPLKYNEGETVFFNACICKDTFSTYTCKFVQFWRRLMTSHNLEIPSNKTRHFYLFYTWLCSKCVTNWTDFSTNVPPNCPNVILKNTLWSKSLCNMKAKTVSQVRPTPSQRLLSVPPLLSSLWSQKDSHWKSPMKVYLDLNVCNKRAPVATKRANSHSNRYNLCI